MTIRLYKWRVENNFVALWKLYQKEKKKRRRRKYACGIKYSNKENSGRVKDTLIFNCNCIKKNEESFFSEQDGIKNSLITLSKQKKGTSSIEYPKWRNLRNRILKIHPQFARKNQESINKSRNRSKRKKLNLSSKLQDSNRL